MAGPPNILLLGYGVLDSLQLTIEAQLLLSRYGSAYCLGLPPNLARYLKGQRVKVTDLADRFSAGRPFAEAYLDVANYLLERTASELPVILLTPGNPLATNAVSRFLAMEAPRHGLTVQAVPAVSQIDVIISAIGLDVSTFGLQVFDASKLVSRRQGVNASVPLLLLHAGGFDLAAVPAGPGGANLRPLADYLSLAYRPEQPVVIITATMSPPGVGLQRTTVAALGAATDMDSGASLFIDAVRG